MNLNETERLGDWDEDEFIPVENQKPLNEDGLVDT